MIFAHDRYNAFQSETQEKLQRSISKLSYSIAAGFVCLCIAVAFFEYFANLDSGQDARTAELLDLAGRQRMLSQKIGRLADLSRTRVADERGYNDELETTRQEFTIESAKLRHGIDTYRPQLRLKYKSAFDTCEQLRKEILDTSERKPVERDVSTNWEDTISVELHASIDAFLPRMESIVSGIEKDHREQIERSRRRETATLIGTVLLVLGCVSPFIVSSISSMRSSSMAYSRMARERNRLALIAELTSNAVIITDCHGRIEWVNAGFTRITEYTLEEVIGRTPGSFLQFHKTEKSAIEKLRTAIRAQHPVTCQILNRSKSGREYWLEISLQPLLDENGVLNGFMAVETDISEMKEVEFQIRDEQHFLKSILESLTSSIAILDSSGRVIASNDRWVDFYSSESPAGMERNDRRLLHYAYSSDIEVAEKIIEGIQRVLNEESDSFEYEYQHTRRGYTLWLRLVATRCTTNGVVNAVVAIEDITERVLSQKKVQDVSDRAKAIFEGSNDAFLLVRDGFFFDCNEKALQIFGVASKEQIVNYHPSFFSPTWQPCGRTSSELANQRMQEAVDKGSVCFEWIHQRADGTSFPAEVLLSSLRLEGNLVLLASVRDITERKETLRYLEMYRSIVDRHAIVAETDTTGTILFANEQFCRISGYEKEELIGNNHRILNSGLHPTSFWKDMFKTIANNETWRGEICNRTKDGSLYWVDTTIAALKNHNGKIRGYFAVRHDITALKIAREEAQAASEAKSQFLANMSHEIRTPMTAILGFADLLADEFTKLDSPAICVDYINTVKRNGEHLLSIINDILDISKIEANKMELERIDASPAQIVEEVMSLMRSKAIEKGISITSILNNNLPDVILSDPTRIRQILMNLVGNAIKFTEKGSVTLESSFIESPHPHLRFAIRDTGIGMTPEQVARLFTAFSQADATTSRRFGGSGLGLQISKRLADMLGGDVHVNSVFGKGSEFVFELRLDPETTAQPGRSPRLRTQDGSIPSPVVQATGPLLEGIRILLAEDGIDNQRLISFYLRKAGAIVTIVENGKQALERLTCDGSIGGPLLEPEPFDLVLTDMQMPEMDGYSLARVLRGKRSRLPIIALTANAMAEDARKCLEAGCNEYTSKPLNSGKLTELCKRWSETMSTAMSSQGAM